MSTTLYMSKQLGSLRPSDPTSAELLDVYPNGADLRVEIFRNRSGRQHRLFFAALGLIFKHQERYRTFNSFRASVMVELGFVDWFKMRDGREIGIPQSVSWDKMEQDTFNDVMNRFCDLVQTKIIPGLKRADLERELKEMGVAA